MKAGFLRVRVKIARVRQMVNSESEVEKLNLTKRELEILCLLPLGLSNDEIANKLYISKGTLRWYLNNLYRKISAGSRSKAIFFANNHKDIINKMLMKFVSKNLL